MAASKSVALLDSLAAEADRIGITICEVIGGREPYIEDGVLGIVRAHPNGFLEVAPDHAPTLNYLGYMWAEDGENLGEALELILRAVALDPDNGAYVDSLGWAYYQLGRFEEARGHLEWAARLIPSDPTIHEHLGDLYVILNDFTHAKASYEQAIELSGDNLDQVRSKLRSLDQKGL